MEHGLNFYKKFTVKNLEEVSTILERHKHASILNNIESTGSTYRIKKGAWNFNTLPTYRLALACTIASLGNPDQAYTIHSSPELALDGIQGDKISQDLAMDLAS